MATERSPKPAVDHWTLATAPAAIGGFSIVSCRARRSWGILPARRSERPTGGRGGAGEIASAPACPSRCMVSIGVIPAIASCEKGQLKATAPASRPSRKTGLPLMPAMTPLFSSPFPVSRARM